MASYPALSSSRPQTPRGTTPTTTNTNACPTTHSKLYVCESCKYLSFTSTLKSVLTSEQSHSSPKVKSKTPTSPPTSPTTSTVASTTVTAPTTSVVSPTPTSTPPRPTRPVATLYE
ncbi:hypothetical protein K435DRAFT_868532 [Dendrothele bispora CBS 962.96]|uniref:Uncharacterized protein n=1 Tax=Dendrothele bispora (strain CBS 962.96) TaxID=1314807 RepID=A0A4S8LBZ9_DENBC|nr:hypothetical protein K435DRAFT_868532 [Dendrothele bispora CBS 962.96]